MSEKSAFAKISDAKHKKHREGMSELNMPFSFEEAASTMNNTELSYSCPLYRTTARYGELRTDGLSSNLIIMVDTPIPNDIKLSRTEPRMNERLS